MASITFHKAKKHNLWGRWALMGPAGSGKTWTALTLAQALGGKIAVIDTEHGSASKYADLFDFDVLELTSFSPNEYSEAVKAAEAAGYNVLVVDSWSHAWMGKNGALELVDEAKRRGRSGNAFTDGWGTVTPMQTAMVETMLAARLHLIVTMRTKMSYVLEEQTTRDGRKTTVPRKVGLQPIQRDGVEYEFDVVGDMDMDNTLIISKSRCPALSGKVFARPGADVAAIFKAWLGEGRPVGQPVTTDAATPPAPAVQSSPSPATSAIPTNGKDFLTYVNANVEIAYDNIHHLQQSIRATTGNPRWSWPNPKDADAWREVYAIAKRHADAKLRQAESEMIGEAESNLADSEPAVEKLPF